MLGYHELGQITPPPFGVSCSKIGSCKFAVRNSEGLQEPVSRALRVPAVPCGDGAAMVSSPPERCSRPAYYPHGATGIVCVEIRCEDEGMIWPLRKVSCLVHDTYTVVLFSYICRNRSKVSCPRIYLNSNLSVQRSSFITIVSYVEDCVTSARIAPHRTL